MLAEVDRTWLDANAEALDTDESLAATVVPRLAQANLLGHGIAKPLGGRGGTVGDAIEAIAQVASLVINEIPAVQGTCSSAATKYGAKV